MSQPVGIVTGAASGMGLALTKHLISKGWKIAMADVNATTGEKIASELGRDVMFHKTDVSSYEQQASLFEKAFTWGGNRLDFFAANAGIDDRQSLYEVTSDKEGVPAPLNLKCIEVDLHAVFQGIWLFKHFAGKNKKPGGTVVITSSGAGVYPIETNPQYGAAKHGLVGLTRSAGPLMLRDFNITINAILPGFVATGLAPAGLVDRWPKEYVTPMTTVLRAFDLFLGEKDMTGQCVELSGEDICPHSVPKYPNEVSRWLHEESKSLWAEAYSVVPVRGGE